MERKVTKSKLSLQVDQSLWRGVWDPLKGPKSYTVIYTIICLCFDVTATHVGLPVSCSTTCEFYPYRDSGGLMK